MRLEDWQKYIESEFLDDVPSERKDPQPVSSSLSDKLQVADKQPDSNEASLSMPNSASRREKEEAQHTPTLRLKRRRNLTSAENVAYDMPSFPSEADTGMEASPPKQYLLLQSSPANGTQVSDVTVGVVEPEFEHATERDEPSIEEIPAENSDPAPANSPETSAIEISPKTSRPQIPIIQEMEIPSFATYLPGSLGRSKLPVDVRESEKEKPQSELPRRKSERTLSLSLNLGEGANELAGCGYLKTLSVLQKIRAEDSLRGAEPDDENERRQGLLEKLLNPELTLEETAHLLKVCPTTVRRYTNQGILKHHRKGLEGVSPTEAESFKTKQRRFRLLDVLEFLDSQMKSA